MSAALEPKSQKEKNLITFLLLLLTDSGLKIKRKKKSATYTGHFLSASACVCVQREVCGETLNMPVSTQCVFVSPWWCKKTLKWEVSLFLPFFFTITSPTFFLHYRSENTTVEKASPFLILVISSMSRFTGLFFSSLACGCETKSCNESLPCLSA